MGDEAMMKHTPTPWKLQPGFNTIFTTSNPEQGTGITTAIAAVLDHQLEDKAQAPVNGEFICLAANNHEALVDALNGLVISGAAANVRKASDLLAKIEAEAKGESL